MPKVSERYKDARREQIMAAARRCFLRNGFRETSMTDLFAESGLSSGAFYRYFAGKDELIIAIARDNLREVIALIHAAAQRAEGSLGDILADVIEHVSARHAEDGVGGIAMQVWAEALRNPHVAAEFHSLLEQLHEELTEMVRRNQASGALPADASAEALSNILFAIVPGHIVQLAILGPEAVSGAADALRALWPKR